MDYLASRGDFTRTGAGYLVDEDGGIDWNRDGIISDCDHRVQYSLERSSTRSANGYRYRQYDRDTINTTHNVSTPSLAYSDGLPGVLHLGYVMNSVVHLQSAPYDGTCLHSYAISNEGDNTCLDWSDPIQTNTLGQEVTLAFENGKLWIFTVSEKEMYVQQKIGDILSVPELLSDNIKGPPSVVTRNGNLELFWGGHFDYSLFRRTLDLTTETWSSTEELLEPSGAPIHSRVPPSVVVLPNSQLLLGYTTAENIIAFREQTSNGRWVSSSTYGDWSPSRPGRTAYPFGLVWRPDHICRPEGSGYLIAVHRSTDDEGLVLTVHRGVGEDGTNRTEASITISDKLPKGLGSAGVFTFFPPGGINAVGAIYTTNPEGNNVIEFFPKLDGIPDVELDATNDYRVISHCISTINSTCNYQSIRFPRTQEVPASVFCAE